MTDSTVADSPADDDLQRCDRLRDVVGFRTYAASRIVAWTGSLASAVALPVMVYQLTGSAALTGMLAAAESLPYLLLGMHVGALVDRWNAQRVMMISAMVCAAALATVPLVAAVVEELSAVHLLLVALVGGTSFVFLDAASFGTLPRLVGKQLIGSATSLLAAWGTMLGVAIPALVGIALPLVGGVPIIAVDAGLCALSTVLLTRVPMRADAEVRSTGPHRLRDEIREGLTFIWRHPVIRPLTFLGFCNSFTGGAVTGLIVVVGVRNLGFTEDDGRFGWLYAVLAAGAFLGSVAIGRLQARVGVGPLALAGYPLTALLVVGWASATSWIVASALLAGRAFVDMVIILNGIVTRQTLTPMRLQGRVNTTARVIAWGGTPLGAATGGALTEWWGLTAALYACAVPVAVACVVGLAWRLPSVGRLADLSVADPARQRPEHHFDV